MFTNQPINKKKFSVTLTETLGCWEIGLRWYEFSLYTRALSCSQLGLFQLIFNVFYGPVFKILIFYQINFAPNFSLYIMIEGSSQQLLVISQFSQFFDVMAHISAERHLSKISFSYIFLHPMTTPNFLGNNIFFGVPKFNITWKIFC